MSESAVEPVRPDQFASIGDRVARISTYPGLGESVWRDLRAPHAESAAFFADDTAFAHVARSDNFMTPHWAVGFTGARNARSALLTAALQHAHDHGGGRVVFWLLGAHSDDDAPLAQLGFRVDRELLEMRVPLPIDEEPRWPVNTHVRTFEPGRDDAAWLDVNNRAFQHHAEQGGWIEATLQRRMSDPWFDPSIFFLAFDDKGLAGFNWMKLHDADGRDPRLGEIFVIGVDPRTQGSGLGRALAIKGLNAAHERGVDTGSLYVAAENAGALHLYRALGFTIHRTDRAYEVVV